MTQPATTPIDRAKIGEDLEKTLQQFGRDHGIASKVRKRNFTSGGFNILFSVYKKPTEEETENP